MKADREWMALDNAAKIYPAAMRRNWTALFRVSMTLHEPIDLAILEEAQRRTLARFPGFCLRLRRGMFWYYLEKLEGMPQLQQDVGNPCVRMRLKDNGRFMFRVRYHNRRIALEVFHVLADGSGGMCFLKTMVAEYLRLKYGADIPRDGEILDCEGSPQSEELEDAYLRFAKGATRSRKEANAFVLRGTKEKNGVNHIITAIMPAEDVRARAKECGVTLTEYLTAAMIFVIDGIQRQKIRRRRYREVKICVPVNLRKFYPTRTMRNFSSYVNPGIDPNLGKYSFEEILRAIHHYMGLEVTEKLLNAKFTSNVRSEENTLLRITPLFLKNVAMRLVFRMVGDCKTTTCFSNLGVVKLPPEMARYVERTDFMLGPLSRNKVAIGAVSYGGNLVINFVRTIRETEFERELLRFLVKQGIHVRVESNNG